MSCHWNSGSDFGFLFYMFSRLCVVGVVVWWLSFFGDLITPALKIEEYSVSELHVCLYG